MNQLTKDFDNLLDNIQSMALSFLLKLGPFCVALMPALFTAYAIYHTFRTDAGQWLALTFAFVVGLGMETVGIVATHTATDLYNGSKRGIVDAGKFWLMVALVPVYVFGVAGVVYFSGDAFTDLVRSLGIVSPFLTCIVYVAVALARDLIRIQQNEASSSQHRADTERAELEYKRALEREKLSLEHERRLKEQELSAQVQIEQAHARSTASIERARLKAQAGIVAPEQTQSQHAEPPEPARASTFMCQDCGRSDFGTIQALNAHQRFCTAKIRTNGTGK